MARSRPSDRITVACIGTGWQGGNNVQSFLEEPGAQVVAVCDIDSEHLETARQTINKKYGNQDCKTYHAFEEVLARRDIDAVMLAVPDHWHGVLGTAAAAAGKDIYGEKPLAHNFAEGAGDLSRRWSATGACGRREAGSGRGTNFRFACELVRNGRIGKVTRVEVGLPGGLTDFDGPGPDQDSPCRRPRRSTTTAGWVPRPMRPTARRGSTRPGAGTSITAGAMLMDWVGHHVDIAHWGLGFDHTGPVEVEGTGEFLRSHRVWNAPSRFQVKARYANGVVLEISGGFETRRGVTWYGDEGWIWVDRSGIDAKPRSDPDEQDPSGRASLRALHQPPPAVPGMREDAPAHALRRRTWRCDPPPRATSG